MMWRLLLLVVLLMFPTIAMAEVGGEACQPFYRALDAVPHESVFQREGLYNSRWFETGATGCFLVMNTSEERLGDQTMPDLSAAPGTALYEAGWRANPKYAADGPGTGVVGLEKDDVLCLVYTDQPSYVNDDDQIVQTVFIKVRVECLDGAKGENYRIMLRGKE